MTTSPDSFGNGVPKNEDRFATQLGQYRPSSRRDVGRLAGEHSGSDLTGRNGSSVLDTRNGSSVLDPSAPIASSLAAPALPELPSRKHEPPSRVPDSVPRNHESAARKHDAKPRQHEALTRSICPADVWGDSGNGSLVDHPLLRGLLLELPPKGAVPDPEYLDRWFEAARSILDLLYAMSARQ